MRKVFTLGPLLVAAALVTSPAWANTCKAKKVKVKHVCGIVVDGSGVPIQGVTLQVVSGKDEPLTTQVVTSSDGRFSLEDTPTGDLFLAISSRQYNSGRWPLKVTGKAKAGQCARPLKVRLAGTLGWACGDWVDQK